ncbi:2OG-Fe(II) oxygenase [Streptomyces malaysiensis]|uniref:Putative hydroxylase n=1 Tax=Streptomyces malaysiensis TaxID=92644 RepID=A0A2K8BM47_STRMQ|nr:2OG-Fe(II) oxygenase [Streptomyces malaysiensis]AIE47498.1 putative hydroxylase [Streptomyces malaysiensis]
MLLLDLNAPVERHDEPYRWAVAHSIIPEPTARILREQLPAPQDLHPAERTGDGDKTYRMAVLPLIHRGAHEPGMAKVGEKWHELVSHLQSDAYRDWVNRTIGIDVTDTMMDIGLFVFRGGDRISAHTDKPGKRATHVIYLNDDWRREHGGHFEVRTGPDLSISPYATVIPGGGRSVVFARSERSWHAVAPVAAHAPQFRLTCQVEMWNLG